MFKTTFTFIFGIIITINSFSQCSFWTEVPVDLGNDTVLCHNEDLLLDAGTGYDFYNWSTGETTQSITVDATGTYIVTAGVVSNNLIVNGDFENGDVGFTTQYVQGTGGTWGTLTDPGTYDISTSPSLSHNNFTYCGDQTSGSGNMMVVNGSDTPGTEVWCQSINVVQNTDYLFSTWVTNALNDFNVAELQFSINGSQIGNPFVTSPYGCDWLEFNEVWNSGLNTNANVCIVNQNTIDSGNDFAIDNITFQEVCIVEDTIDVLIDAITIDAGLDLTFCANEPQSITATSADDQATFVWNGEFQGATFTPTVNGYQYVTATSVNGCSATDILYVNIIGPTASFIAAPSSGEAPLTVDFTNNSQEAIDYYWDFANGNINTTNDLSSQNTVYNEPGTYNVMLLVSDGTCTDTTYTIVTVNDKTLPSHIVVPNVFTPNDDSVNDEFSFTMMGIETINISIVNRWGETMFESDNIAFAWDGRVGPLEATPGTYFYKYTATDINGETIKGQGFLELIRDKN